MTRPNPWHAPHAPSGELNAKSEGVGSLNSRPQRGQWSPRRNVRVRPSIRASSEPASAKAVSTADAISGRAASDTTNRPTTIESRPSASSRGSAESPISTVSPSGETARKKPARLNSASRAPSCRGAAPLRAVGGRIPPGHRGHQGRARPGLRRAERLDRPIDSARHGVLAAVRARGRAAVGEEQAQRVVNLGLRSDRRAGVANPVLLLQRDRRRHRLDGVHVGPVQPLQELPGVGRERLGIPALALGVERVEGQRRLAGPRDPGDDGQPRERDLDRDVLEVVSPGSLDADGDGGLRVWRLLLQTCKSIRETEVS